MSYEVLDENLFYQNCQKLTELGEEYLKIVKNKKLPKLFLPPILHKNITSVTTYVNTAYSKQVMTFDEFINMKLNNLIKEFESESELIMELATDENGVVDEEKMAKLPSKEEIKRTIENLKKDLEELQKKYNAKFVILRLSSCDFRAKLRDDEKEIKRITLKEQGTFFLGTPKFYEQPPKSIRNDLYENRSGIYKINNEFYLSNLEDISLL
ncbi:hypothetical protein VSU16_16045 (plasmid) [Cetobacterium somerae]|uniref:hypothetical protein n=1 Tax=Cetobacterium somerae TaxID=188913 RepID=UPI002E7BDE9D|nr:hypothetical protein [Cetobacterium somerae]WVJ03339.1 hypothetical protein VSU16_16045 [Cetobacterium somerae]